MSYFNPTASDKINYDNKIVYDFYRTTVNKSEVQRNAPNMNYFKAPFGNNASNPNFFYTSNGTTTKYSTQNVYIYGSIHNNITGISVDNNRIIGELLIELQSAKGDKAYVCFLLEKPPPYGSPPTGDIDNLISLPDQSNSLSTDIVLNNSISTQETAIVYNNNGQTIFIFTEPIIIGSKSVDLIISNDIKTTSFSEQAPTSYVLIPRQNISIKQDDEIYMDCNPTGESEDTINTYNAPIKSKFMETKQEFDVMKTTLNFAMFTFVLIGCYFTAPPLYKYMVYDVLPTDDQDVAIDAADGWMALAFIFWGIYLVSSGNSLDNNSMVYSGVVILMFWGLSYSIIRYNKINNKSFTDLFEYFNNEGNPVRPFELNKMLKQMFEYLKIFTEWQVWAALGVVWAIELIILIPLKTNTDVFKLKDAKNNEAYFASIIMFVILVTVFIVPVFYTAYKRGL